MKKIEKEQKRMIAYLYERKEIVKKWNNEYMEAIQYKRQNAKILGDYFIMALAIIAWGSAILISAEVFMTWMLYLIASFITPIVVFNFHLRTKRNKWLQEKHWDIVPLEDLEALYEENGEELENIEKEILERTHYLEECHQFIDKNPEEIERVIPIETLSEELEEQISQKVEETGRQMHLNGLLK